MDTIENTYPINNHLELQVIFESGSHQRPSFRVVNTDNGAEEEISENAAKAMCTAPDSSVTYENWEDFVRATGIFKEDI